MQDSDLLQAAQTFAIADDIANVERNVYESHGVNGDKYAQQARMARVLGEPTPVDQESILDVEKRYAAMLGVSYAGNPLVRRILADNSLAKLIADSPPEWDNLGVLDKALTAWKSGRLQAMQTGAVENLTARNLGIEPGAEGRLADFWNARELENAATIAEAQYQQSRLAVPPDLQRMSDAESVGDFFSILAESPLQGLMYPVVQSIASQAETLGAAAVASAVNPIAGAAVLGAGSMATEYAATLLDTMRDAGVDTSNYEALLEAWRNPELVRNAMQRGLIRGGIIGGLDALTAGVASKVFMPATAIQAARRMNTSYRAAVSTLRTQPTSTLAQEFGGRAAMENVFWQALVQGAGGGGGEALGSLAIGDEVRLGDVLLEAIAEFGSAPVEVASIRARAIYENAQQRRQAQSAMRDAQAVEIIEQAQDSSVLNKRAPEVFEAQVQRELAGTGKESVSISAADMRGFAQEAVQASPAIAAQWREANISGGDVTIPVSEFMRLRRESPEVYQKMREVARFGTDAMSLQEAQAFAQENAPNLEQQVNELMTAVMEDVQSRTEAVEAARQQLRQQSQEALAPVREQLRAAGRSQDEVNSAIAVQAAILENIASEAGMTPQEWMAANPLSVVQAQKPKSRRRKGRGFSQAAQRGNFDPTTGQVTLFNADRSTFIHEAAHYWLNSMAATAQTVINNWKSDGNPNNNPLVKLVGDFLAWGKVGDENMTAVERIGLWNSMSENQQRPMHEQFATGFETYLMEGRAPTRVLERVFAKFVKWLKSIYRNAAPLGVEMSEDVIALYDNLFVSQASVAEAQGRINAMGLYDDLVRAGMTEDEFTDFVDTRAQALENAEARLRAAQERDARLAHNRRVREERGLNNEFEDMVDAAETAIRSQTAFRALAAFGARGIVDANGQTRRFKLNASLLDRNVADGELTAENREWLKTRRIQARRAPDGAQLMDPKFAATYFGYENVNALVDALREAYNTDVHAVAEAQAREQFLNKYGEAYTRPNVSRMAAVATQEAASLDVLATETAALRRALGRRTELRQAVQAFAKQAVGRRQLMEIATGRNGQPRWRMISAKPFRDAAARAARKAEEAFRKGDTAAAADAKQVELVQTAIAKEIDTARARAEAFRQRLRRGMRSQSVAGRYSVQIHKIANALGVRSAKPYTNEPSFTSFLKRAPELTGLWNALPERLVQDGELAVPEFTDLTVDELTALDNLINGIIKAGRVSNRNAKNEKNSAIAEQLTEGTEAIRKAMTARGRRKFEPDTGQFSFKRWFDKGIAYINSAHLRAGNFLQALDGNRQGFWTQLIGWRANDCAVREAQLTEQGARTLNDIMSPWYTTLFSKPTNRAVANIRGRTYTYGEALAVILNAGNEGNLIRLQNGNGLTIDDINYLASRLSVDDLNRVQRIWDYFEQLRQLAAEKARRVDGFEPEWVQASPITLQARDGAVQLRGGYYPIMYDRNANVNAEFFKEIDDAKVNGNLSVTTSQTYTKARTPTGLANVPLRLDFTAIFSGAREVIHDVSWQEFVNDFNKYWRGVTVSDTDADGNATQTKVPGLQAAVHEYFGPQGTEVFKNWIQYIANDGPVGANTSVDRITAFMRQNVSIAGLGFNFKVALIQLTGLIPAAAQIGTGNMLHATWELMTNPARMIGDVNALSGMMANRTSNRIRELHEVSSSLSRHPARTAVFRTAFMPISFMQGLVDYTTWKAAFNKALSEGMSQAAAARAADQALINTQGSGLIHNRSTLEQKGGAYQLFLSFYSFMGTAYNLMAQAQLGEASALTRAKTFFTVLVVLPMLEAQLRSLTEGGEDDDRRTTEEEIVHQMRQVVGHGLGFALGTMVFARELSSAAENAITGENVYAWRGPAGARSVDDLVTLIMRTNSALDKGEWNEAASRALLNTAGLFFGLPTAQLWKTYTGAAALYEGDTDNPLALLTGYKEKK